MLGSPGWNATPLLARRPPQGIRACVEVLGLIVGLTLASSVLAVHLSPANHALLCMTLVVIAGIRHGFAAALLASLAAMGALSFFNLEPRFSLHAERVEDWVTLTCFALASFLTGNLAGRFRRQLEETRTIAMHNEQLHEASRLLAGTFQVEELVRVLLQSAGAVTASETVLLLPGPQGRLALAHTWGGELDTADRAAADRVYRACRAEQARPDALWYFVPLLGERGALGVLGACTVARAPLGGEQRRLLAALCHSGGVALERCRLSEEMRSAQMAVDEEKLRAALLSSVSHDLRTPLASIIGATSTLNEIGESIPPAEQSELLCMVQKEAERLDRLVGNLLDMARIGHGRLEPRPTWCDVRDVIAEVVRGLHLVPAQQKLSVSLEREFPLLFVDAVLLERVVENLVDNAVKHAGSDLPIQVTAGRSGDTAVIRVLDQGPGLPCVEGVPRHSLLRRARRSDGRPAGSGLGLEICQAFVDALGGALRLLPGPGGRGLCAEIRLPCHALAQETEKT